MLLQVELISKVMPEGGHGLQAFIRAKCCVSWNFLKEIFLFFSENIPFLLYNALINNFALIEPVIGYNETKCFLRNRDYSRLLVCWCLSRTVRLAEGRVRKNRP